MTESIKSNNVGFKDVDGLRHSWPRDQVGVSEAFGNEEGSIDRRVCRVSFGSMCVAVPMSFGAFRRLLDAGQKPSSDQAEVSRNSRYEDAEIERLQVDVAEAYQAVGAIADSIREGVGMSDENEAAIGRLMANLLAAADGYRRPHADLLPFRFDLAQSGGGVS